MVETETTDLSAKDMVEMYRLMLLGRRFTEHVLDWYTQGRTPQGLHPSIGQEAVGVGACYGLRADDWVLPSLRTSDAFWTRGVTVRQQLHAMFGTARSISGGKETSHHSGYPDLGILACTGIVGGHIPVATGLGMAFTMQGSDAVVACFFGDGAANRGDFHEGINLAAVVKAPVVFICENNLYAQTVAGQDAMAVTDIADRALGYGIPGVIVDGQDVLAVHQATQQAVARARSGQGPTLMEIKTYRFKPHYPIFEELRSPEEIAKWTQRDPIDILGSKLKADGLLTDDAVEAMDRSIVQELADAIAEAEAAPQPDPKQVFTNICAQDTQGENQ